MIETLTPIWQRLLQHSPILPDDNFFELGGDSSIAVELFNEIAKACGRELPPVTIYHASTIAGLASLLEQTISPRLPSLVQLRPGTTGKPVFIAHGLGGSAMEFFQLVKHIDAPNPIYGMQARGTDGMDEPLDSIEDMAQFHLNAIREFQPQGPYFLVGYSLGGLVTLEMARRLTEKGEQVALLREMVDQWLIDEDMAHGFVVPIVVVWIIWREREGWQAIPAKPSRWGLLILAAAAALQVVAVLAAGLFAASVAFLVSIVGLIVFLRGFARLRSWTFPLVLTLFMLPKLAIVYNQATLPLQLLASRMAAGILTFSGIGVIREGNILDVGGHRSAVIPARTASARPESIFTIVAGQFHEWDYGSPPSRGRR